MRSKPGQPGDRVPPPTRNGLPIGSPAPEFELAGLFGETLTLQALRADGRRVLLVFFGPAVRTLFAVDAAGCTTWQAVHRDSLTIAVISRGDVDANRAKAAESGVRAVIRQKDNEVADLYSVHGTPSAVLVNADGTIASGIAAGPEAIAGLVSSATAPAIAERKAPSRTQKSGGFRNSSCPISTGNGHQSANSAERTCWCFSGVRLPAFVHECSTTLELCLGGDRSQRGAPACRDLDRLHLRKPRNEPRQPGSERSGQFGRAEFGCPGTPMAIRLDAAGRIDSQLAAGAEAVFDLARNLPFATGEVRNGRR